MSLYSSKFMGLSRMPVTGEIMACFDYSGQRVYQAMESVQNALLYRANRAQSYVEEVKALELFEEVRVETVPDFPNLYDYAAHT